LRINTRGWFSNRSSLDQVDIDGNAAHAWHRGIRAAIHCAVRQQSGVGAHHERVRILVRIGRHLRVIGISVGIRPVLDKHFPLAQLGDAFRYQETGAHFGKIIVDI
jgi:Zinc-binding dehydrogenase